LLEAETASGWPLDAGADIFTRLSYDPQDRLVDIKDVTVILGHSSVTVSLERYSRRASAVCGAD
jgi:hypothetical protein